MSGASVTDDGQYVIITTSKSTHPTNKLYIAKLDKDWNPNSKSNFFIFLNLLLLLLLLLLFTLIIILGLEFHKVVDNFEASYDYIANDGDVFYFKTNLNAPKYKIVTMTFEPTNPGKEYTFKEIVPEQEDPLDFVSCVNNDKLVTVYLRHVKV